MHTARIDSLFSDRSRMVTTSRPSPLVPLLPPLLPHYYHTTHLSYLIKYGRICCCHYCCHYSRCTCRHLTDSSTRCGSRRGVHLALRGKRTCALLKLLFMLVLLILRRFDTIRRCCCFYPADKSIAPLLHPLARAQGTVQVCWYVSDATGVWSATDSCLLSSLFSLLYQPTNSPNNRRSCVRRHSAWS